MDAPTRLPAAPTSAPAHLPPRWPGRKRPVSASMALRSPLDPATPIGMDPSGTPPQELPAAA